jgi:hypothetical protein
MAEFVTTTISFRGPEEQEREIRQLIDSYCTDNEGGQAITHFSDMIGTELNVNRGWRHGSTELWKGTTKWQAPIGFVLAMSECYPEAHFHLRCRADSATQLRTTVIADRRVVHDVRGYYKSCPNQFVPHSHYRLRLRICDDDWVTFLRAAAEDNIAWGEEYDCGTTRSASEIRQWFQATLPDITYDIIEMIPFTVCDDAYLTALFQHALSHHDVRDLDSAPPLQMIPRERMADLEREIELSYDELVQLAEKTVDRLCREDKFPQHLVLRLLMIRNSMGSDEFDRRCGNQLRELPTQRRWVKQWLSVPEEVSVAANYGGPFWPTQTELLSLLPEATIDRRNQLTNAILSPRWEGHWLVEYFGRKPVREYATHNWKVDGF